MIHNHRVHISWDGSFAASVKIVCPADRDGCSPGQCYDCGRYAGNESMERCPLCPRAEECWADSWNGSCEVDDFLRGELDIPVTVRWDDIHSHPILEIAPHEPVL